MENVNFEKELKRLNEIVDTIANKQISLDESLKLYEEGSLIIKNLEKALSEAKEKTEKIIDIK